VAIKQLCGDCGAVVVGFLAQDTGEYMYCRACKTQFLAPRGTLVMGVEALEEWWYKERHGCGTIAGLYASSPSGMFTVRDPHMYTKAIKAQNEVWRGD